MPSVSAVATKKKITRAEKAKKVSAKKLAEELAQLIEDTIVATDCGDREIIKGKTPVADEDGKIVVDVGDHINIPSHLSKVLMLHQKAVLTELMRHYITLDSIAVDVVMPYGSGKTFIALAIISMLVHFPDTFKKTVTPHKMGGVIEEFGPITVDTTNWARCPPLVFAPKSVVEVWEETSVKNFPDINLMIVRTSASMSQFMFRMLEISDSELHGDRYTNLPKNNLLGTENPNYDPKRDPCGNLWKIPPLAEVNCVVLSIGTSLSVSALEKSFPKFLNFFNKTSEDIFSITQRVMQVLHVVTPWIGNDDYDVSKLSPAGAFTAEKICYLSASSNISTKRPTNDCVENVPFKDQPAIDARHGHVDKAQKLKYSISCSDKFVSESNVILKPVTYIWHATGGNGAAMDMLANVSSDLADRVLQALTAGSSDHAAKMLGLDKIDTPVDLLRGLLKQQYGEFQRLTASVARIEMMIEWLKDTEDEERNHLVNNCFNESYKYPYEEIIKGEEPKFYNLNIFKDLETALRHQQTSLINPTKAIEQMRGNLQHNCCPNCQTDKAEVDNWMLFSCCGYVMCAGCVASQYIDKATLGLTCTNCRTKVSLPEHTVFLGKDLDIDAIISPEETENAVINNYLEQADAAIEEAAETGEVRPDDPIEKIQILARLLSTKNRFKVQEIVDRPYVGLMGTPSDNPSHDYTSDVIGSQHEQDPETRAVLIFSTYSNDHLAETMRDDGQFDDYKIFVLRGSSHVLNKIVMEAREYSGKLVIIANSHEQCSGMNLQFIRDVVFYNSDNNLNYESQGVGRIVRCGSKGVGRVHYIKYNCEL